MKLNYNKKLLLPEENTISYKYEKDSKIMYFELWLYTDKFKEYQKNLFNEFYSSLIDIIESNDIFLDFKKELESKIKQFNTQLKVFQEKTNLEEKIEIRWNLQVIWDNYYISSLIWESSIVIYRNDKLEVVVPNEVEDDDKIDIFSEIIEWELENNDKILSMACNIYNYMTDNEIKELAENEDIQNVLADILSLRIDVSEIWFISCITVSIEKIILKEKKELDLEKYKNIISKNKHVIWIIIALSIIFFIVISIFLYLWKSNDKTIVKIWNKEIELDISEIKRDIDAFSKLDSENTADKQEKYNKIMTELDQYEKSGIQQLEIRELRKKMEQNYYKWFNINIVNENDGILNNIYNISEDSLKDTWELKWIVQSKWKINIFWEKGVILWIVNNKTKWVKQTLSIPTSIKTCVNNLSNNGLYCILNNNDIYNFSSYWSDTLKNNNNNWPEDIVSLWTYWVNKIYLLTLDKTLNDKNIFIRRYLLKSKNSFSNPTNYVFTKNDLTKNIYTGSSLSVDWSFLIWGKNWLLQAYRKSVYDNKIYVREIKWWEQWIVDKENDFKWDVKVIAYPNSNFVYLYDYNTNSLVVYYSRYKNSEKSLYTYQLTYLFKVKIDLSNEKVKDIFVDNKKTNPNAYILTNKKIYKIDLSQFRE